MTTPSFQKFLTPRTSALAFSFIATLVFFFPSLIHKSSTAGFMYTGDILGFYWPSAFKMQRLISHFHFNAIDVNLFNGSYDFFDLPNFFAVHPFFVIFSLLSGPFKPDQFAVERAMVLIIVLQSFLSCYFTMRLCERYFALGFGGAAFAAVFFTFGMNTVDALGEPEELFAVTMLPWVAYAALEFRRQPSLVRLPLAAFPTLMLLLSGYMPVAVACLLLACGIVAYVCLTDETDASLAGRLGGGLVAAIPVAAGGLIATPYMLDMLRFMSASPSANTASLFYSAQQLGELPQSVLRLLSVSFALPGPMYEFHIMWGLICVYVALLFLANPGAGRSLSRNEWRTLITCLTAYAATVLAIYGAYSPVANMVFFFVPKVGGMHIYQRFVYPANLLVGVAIAIMFAGLLRSRAETLYRSGAGLCLLLTMAAAYIVSINPGAGKIGLNNAIVFELILLALFACTLITPTTKFKYASLIFLAALPALNAVYGFAAPTWERSAQAEKQPALLDPATQNGVAAYFRSISQKALIKYVDLTPMWSSSGAEPFSKNFPYLVQDKIQLSNYDGFNFYLSPPANYMAKMPVQGANVQTPDWQYMRHTGADFVVTPASGLPGLLQGGYIKSVDQGILHLPNDVAIAPLAPDPTRPPSAFDNGYFRVDGRGQPQVTKSKSNAANLFEIDVSSSLPSVVTYELWFHPGLRFKVDGKKILPSLEAGVASLSLPAGAHHVQAIYRNSLQTIFWVLFLSSLAVWAFAGGMEIFRSASLLGPRQIDTK